MEVFLISTCNAPLLNHYICIILVKYDLKQSVVGG